MSDDYASEKDGELFKEIALFSVVVNEKISCAEAFGFGFPDVPLFAMFRAFDYIAASYDTDRPYDEDGHEITPSEHLDAAHAMLCLAYFHASVSIAKFYDDEYGKQVGKYESVDMRSYEHDQDDPDNKLGTLHRAEASWEEARSLFNESFAAILDQTLEKQAVWLINMSRESRDKWINTVDIFVGACNKRRKALYDAIPLFEQEISRVDQTVEQVEKIAQVAKNGKNIVKNLLGRFD